MTEPLRVSTAQSWMATYFITASRKQEGSSQLLGQRLPYSMRGMVDKKASIQLKKKKKACEMLWS